jgi:hypothetical protein
MKKLTAAQAKAVETLRATASNLPVNKYGSLETGINLNVLRSLSEMGIIECRNYFIGGSVTADFKFNDTPETIKAAYDRRMADLVAYYESTDQVRPGARQAEELAAWKAAR